MDTARDRRSLVSGLLFLCFKVGVTFVRQSYTWTGNVIGQRATSPPARDQLSGSCSLAITCGCMAQMSAAGIAEIRDQAPHITYIASPESTQALVNKYTTFLFDCDGVLWGGSHAIEGSIPTVKALRHAGKRTFFITNNSSKSRRQYCEKLANFGVHGVGIDDIITSGSAIAAYVKHAHPEVSTVYMIGEEGLEEELNMVGLRCIREHRRPAEGMSEDQFRDVEEAADVGAVVVGLDTCFGFRQLCTASLYIQRGAYFVATNPDVADRVGELLMPGTGPILSSIQAASGIAPVIVGKPNPLLIQRVLADNNLEASKTVMIGDRIDTDIMFGNAGGISTALVLTGVSELKHVAPLEPGGPDTPTYLLDRLGTLMGSAEGWLNGESVADPARQGLSSSRM